MTLRSYDFRVDIIPEKETVDSMVKTLGSVRGMRILFPRSAIAPSDVVRMLRASGAVVTVMPLYTSSPAPLSANEKRKILTGIYTTLFFKSPSGVRGLLSHFTKIEALAVRARTAQCIGPTTARAARAAGFAKVSLQPGMHY
jgi:uroporphyrinogen-III synthase